MLLVEPLPEYRYSVPLVVFIRYATDPVEKIGVKILLPLETLNPPVEPVAIYIAFELTGLVL